MATSHRGDGLLRTAITGRRLLLLLLLATAVMAACSPTAHPTPSTKAPSAKIISRGDPKRMVVALTFDASNDAGGTPKGLVAVIPSLFSLWLVPTVET